MVRCRSPSNGAPPNVYFCEESCLLGEGLKQRIKQFVAELPYAELSTFKKPADKYGIAILLIHHLRIVVLPLILLFFLAQKYFVEGIATSGLKG